MKKKPNTKQSTYRYRYVPTPPLQVSLQWSEPTSLWLKPWWVSAVCDACLLDQVFTLVSANSGVVLMAKSEIWLKTCRIHPMVHVNGSLEYNLEMNCVSKGSCFFFCFELFVKENPWCNAVNIAVASMVLLQSTEWDSAGLFDVILWICWEKVIYH